MRTSSYDSVRSLSALRSKIGAALLFFLIVPAWASSAPNMTPVHLRIAGHEVTGGTQSVTDGKEVYVPLESLLAAGAIGRMNLQSDAAVVTRLTDWKRTAITVTRVAGKPMLPLSEVAQFLNADVEWSANNDKGGKAIDDTRGDTVYLLARISDVRVENGAVRITTSFPVPFQVRNLTVESPVRGYVDCQGADVPKDFAPRASRGYSLHVGRFTTETARVVIMGMKLKETEATSNANPMIFAHLGAGSMQVADARVPQNRHPSSLGQDIPNDPGARPSDNVNSPQTEAPVQTRPARPPRGTQPYRHWKRIVGIYSISVTSEGKQRVRLDIATGSAITPYVHYLKDGRHIEIDLPYSQLQLEDADTSNQTFKKNPLLKGLHAEQTQQNPPQTRITLETSRVLDWNYATQGDKLSLEMGLPNKTGGVLAGKLIVVDPGHGGTSSGATGGGVYEKNITLAISLKLRDELQKAGARVVMTRDRDVNVDLYARPQMANSLNADLFVSIHNDSGPVPNTASGTSTWYHMHDPSSRAMAICVQQAVSAVTGLPSRGALSDGIMYPHGFAVLRLSKMPAILVEVAYINNAHDRTRLTDEDFQARVAQAIVRGIRNYIEGNAQTAQNVPPDEDTSSADNPPAGDRETPPVDGDGE